MRQFRVKFHAQRVFDARDVLDAARQPEAFGATDIAEVTRPG
jgi:hypothetical protein